MAKRWCIMSSGKHGLPKKPLLQYPTYETKEECEAMWKKFTDAWPHIKEYEYTIELCEVPDEV